MNWRHKQNKCFNIFSINFSCYSFHITKQMFQADFFVVPKKPKGIPKDESKYWRLSFQIQERDFIHDKGRLKPALRLLKVCCFTIIPILHIIWWFVARYSVMFVEKKRNVIKFLLKTITIFTFSENERYNGA